jgi:hypothetical protein
MYGISLGFRESAEEVKLKGGSGIIFGLNVILFLVSFVLYCPISKIYI